MSEQNCQPLSTCWSLRTSGLPWLSDAASPGLASSRLDLVSLSPPPLLCIQGFGLHLIKCGISQLMCFH